MPHKLLFGAFVPASPVTFSTPGTYSWTVPTGVTSVSVTGQGGSDGSVTEWRANGDAVPSIFLGLSCNATSPSDTLAWSTLQSGHTADVASANSVTTDTAGSSSVSWTETTPRLYCADTSKWLLGTSVTISGLLRRTGTFVANTTLMAQTGNVPIPSGSTIYSATGGSIEKYDTYAVKGGNSTALGQTFLAGLGQSTVSGISVTPSQVYSIVVGDDEAADAAFIQISW